MHLSYLSDIKTMSVVHNITRLLCCSQNYLAAVAVIPKDWMLTDKLH